MAELSVLSPQKFVFSREPADMSSLSSTIYPDFYGGIGGGIGGGIK